MLLVLRPATWLQCGVYYNLETLWRCTLADNPNAWIAHFNLADILVRQGHLDEAVAQYQEQLRLIPASEEGLGNLANVLLLQGHTDDAVAQFRELLSLDPDSAEGHGDLAAALLRQGEPAIGEAIDHAQQAVELSRHTDDTGQGHNDATMLRILAMAYAQAGQYPEAIETVKMALQRAQSQANTPLAAVLSRELASYQAALQSHPSP